MNLTLDKDTMSVAFGSQSVTLLPKEFTLFEYLHAHPNRTFTRMELLDAVWGMETPVDRTVDDHIYRLRRKMAGLGGGVEIETVRGRGYRLKASPSMSTERHITRAPWLGDTDLQLHLRELFHRYVRYGHGEGIHALSSSPQTFGVGADRKLSLRAKFYAGDFRAVVDDTRCSFPEKAFWLLTLFGFLHFDFRQTLDFYERAVASYMLVDEDYIEVICFNLPHLYVHTGQFDVAWRAHQDAFLMSTANQWDGYVPLLQIYEVLYLLYNDANDAAGQALARAEEVLAELQWQREASFLNIVKGLYCLKFNRVGEAETFIDQGIESLQQIRFVNHTLMRVQEILVFLERFPQSARLKQKYQRLWNHLIGTYTDAALCKDVREILEQHF